MVPISAGSDSIGRTVRAAASCAPWKGNCYFRKHENDHHHRGCSAALLARLPRDMPLGLYECPAPYRRLLSDDELRRCINTGRFVVLKDVSCDLPTVKRRVAMVEGSPLSLVNANAAIAWDAIQGELAPASAAYLPTIIPISTSG